VYADMSYSTVKHCLSVSQRISSRNFLTQILYVVYAHVHVYILYVHVYITPEQPIMLIDTCS